MTNSRNLTLICIFALLPAIARAENNPPPRPPNVIFILADDLGYGDLGCYGQKNIKTPRLDRMAAEGMRFTQYYAGSTVCAPAPSTDAFGTSRSPRSGS